MGLWAGASIPLFLHSIPKQQKVEALEKEKGQIETRFLP